MVAPDWMPLKAEILTLLMASLCTISLVNFSLALTMAVIIVPCYLFFQPTRSIITRSLQRIVLLGLSPIVVLLVWSNHFGIDSLSVFVQLLYGYEILGSWTFPMICFGYYPLNIAALCMLALPVGDYDTRILRSL